MKQKGFTMIELLIAISIGLLVVLAVTQVYVMSVRTGTTQRAAANILDANIYGLQHIEKNLRMAGLGLADSSRLNSACSGVVLFASGYDFKKDSCFGQIASATKNPYSNGFTADDATLASTSVTANTQAISGSYSDSMPQLTIQYRAPVDMRDCEGQLVLGPRKAIIASGGGTATPVDVDGQVVVERYFVKNNNGTLELRCDAGRYITESISQDPTPAPKNTAVIIGDGSSIQGLNQNDALIIAGIDDFRVQLGTKNGNSYQYRDINEIINNNIQDPIVSIKLAVLAKGIVAAVRGDLPEDPTYTIFGTEVKMKSGQPQNFIRRVYESNTMLRNSRES